MPWYAASAILYVRFKDGHQTTYPIWENVLLIEAVDAAEAQEKAFRRAQADEGDSNASFTWDDRPAEWVCAGIRKLLTVSHPFADHQPVDGAEVTYSEFTVPDAETLHQLVAGEAVYLRYESE